MLDFDLQHHPYENDTHMSHSDLHLIFITPDTAVSSRTLQRLRFGWELTTTRVHSREGGNNSDGKGKDLDEWDHQCPFN